jgi:hypothetical protein
MNLYGVLTMDLVNSRNITERMDIQENLNRYIEIINNKHSKILLTPISITLGDEWQLITTNPEECYNLAHEFQKLLWEHRINIYAGIGIGSISTKIYDDIRKMDGVCFHLAREALDIAKNKSKLKNNKLIFSKNNRVYLKIQDSIPTNSMNISNDNNNTSSSESIKEAAIDVENSIRDSKATNLYFSSIINTLIENTEILKARMTPKQKETYVSYINLGSYRKIASVNPGTIGSISQRLTSAEFFTIQRNHSLIKELILQYCDQRRD